VHWDLITIILVCISAFCSGFIDSVTGGGGLLQMPVLIILFPQLCHVQLIASNRMSSVVGTLAAVHQYTKVVKVSSRAILIMGLCAAIASVAGTFVMRSVPTSVFKIVLWFVIATLTVYAAFKRDLGSTGRNSVVDAMVWPLVLIGTTMGFYNGVIGPGTGVLLVFALVRFAQLDFLNASTYGKIINSVADLSSTMAFVIQGVVIYQLVLPLLLCNVLGNVVGSRIAIKHGNEFIKKVFFVVMCILLVKMGWDLLQMH
jgi:uncharacterized protein